MDAQIPFREQRVGVGIPAANLFSSVEKQVVPQKDSADSSLENQSGQGKRAGDKRHMAIQEKNRRAQKRFRERQKAKMADMTEQLDEMTKELGKLRMENSALKNRNGALERVLALRDEHIRMLQDEQQVFDLGSTYLREQGALPAPEAQKFLTSGAATPELNATGQQLMSFDASVVKSMPFSTVVSQWKEFVRRLGNFLVEVEGVSEDAQNDRYKTAFANLCQTLDSAGEMCMQIAVLHPTNMQRLIAATLDEGRSGVSADDESRWASITAALQLSDEQKGQIIALWHIFERRMNKVMVIRQGILEKLQSVTIPDRMIALQSVISETLKVNEATAALKANLQEEHLCGMEFIGTVFKTIMLPMQKARLIVQSYPFYPDINRIAMILVKEKEAGVPGPLDAGVNMPGISDLVDLEP